MKKIVVPFILFGIVIIAVGCKTAPSDKHPEPLPAETTEEATDESDTTQKPDSEKPYTASAQITDISLVIEQADASFVSKQHKGAGKMFVTIFAKYQGDLTAQDFQEAFFASPTDVWLLNEKNAEGLIEINKKDKLV